MKDHKQKTDTHDAHTVQKSTLIKITKNSSFIQYHSFISVCCVAVHCNGNPINVFLFRELRGLFPSSTFMCLCAIFPGSVHIFPVAKKADRSWEYIYKLLTDTDEYGNWDWIHSIPFLGMFVQIFGIASLQCSLKSGSCKGTVSRDFRFLFFSWIILPNPLKIKLGSFKFFFSNSQRYLQVK